MTTTATDPATYTVEEFGAVMGISRSAAYRLCKAGRVPTIRLGSRVLVSKAWVAGLLDGRFTLPDRESL